MATALPPDFSEFLQLLNSNRVQYLLIGGYAINIYGYSRNTQDLDVWVAIEKGNADRIVQALHAFGFAAATPELFLEPSQVIRMGVPPMRIEILTSISGVEFDECYERRRIETIAGVDIPVIGPDDLIANKLASGRLKDRADAERIVRMTQGKQPGENNN